MSIQSAELNEIFNPSARLSSAHTQIAPTDRDNISAERSFRAGQRRLTRDIELLNGTGQSEAVHRPPNKTYLIDAVERGDTASVRSLIAAGAKLDELTSAKECAIISAFPHPEILQMLIEAGANVNIATKTRKTPLHIAGEQNNVEAIKTLIRAKANINAQDLYGRTPLHYQCRPHSVIPLILLDSGADIHITDDQGWKPLHHAYKWSNIDLLQTFMKKGGRLDEFTPDGMNALHYAAGSCAPDRMNLLEWLVDHQKMDANQFGLWAEGKPGSLTPLMHAIGIQRHFEEDFKGLEFLLTRGADINAKIYSLHPNGRRTHTSGTILSWAKAHNHIPRYVVNWLIAHGAKE